jgi:Arc/MetJ family transcription regulator
MKTTIELPDSLVQQARQVARAEGSTLRALVEEGLQHALRVRSRRESKSLDLPVYGGSGLTDAFRDARWADIRDAVYRGWGS